MTGPTTRLGSGGVCRVAVTGARPYGGRVAEAGRVARLSASWLLRAGVIATIATLVVGVSNSATSAAPASPCGSSSAVPQYKHIVVIAFENHSYASILGSAAPASYFKTLASECGSATNFTSASFPHSLPNYLAVTSGTTGGVTGDCLPSTHCSVLSASIFDQVGASSWRVWAESMPQPCDSQNQSSYVTRHNPALYYPAITAATCRADDQPMPTTVPNPGRTITWITPNLQHDLTIGTLADASTWLSTLLTGPGGLLHSKAYTAGNTAIFIWFDSGADTDAASTPIPLIVIAPSTGHRVVTIPLDDYQLLHGWESLLGQSCLANACTAKGFDKAFRL